MAKKKTNHYIDNKEFYAAMKQWKEQVINAESQGEGKPPVTEYIGKCFVDIATNLAWRPNFINYPYRDEMIGDGIENCLMYCSNFDPEKSKKFAKMYVENLTTGYHEDIQIWENKTYQDKPILAPGDGPIGKLRKWYSQFFLPRAA